MSNGDTLQFDKPAGAADGGLQIECWSSGQLLFNDVTDNQEVGWVTEVYIRSNH